MLTRYVVNCKAKARTTILAYQRAALRLKPSYAITIKELELELGPPAAKKV